MDTSTRPIIIKLTSLNIAALVSSFILAIIFYSGFYLWRHRRYYSMMRKLPGPPPLPIIGNMLTLYERIGILNKFSQLAAEYPSPTVLWHSLFMPIVVVFDTENIKIVSNSLQREEFGVLNGFGGAGLQNASVERWRKLRPTHNQCFGQKHMAQYLDVMNMKSDLLTNRLKLLAIGGKIFNIWNIVHVTNTEMALETMTGYNFKSLGLDPSEFAESELVLSERGTEKLHKKPWLHISDTLFKLNLLLTGEYRFIKIAKKHTRAVLDAKMKDDSIGSTEITPIPDEKERKPKNYLDSIFKVARKYPELANLNDMGEDLWSILSPALDNTSTLACFLLLMFAMHENAQQRVYEEILSVFENEDRPVTMDDLTKLTYLEQCLKETLRRITLVPATSRRMTSDTTLSNKSILPKDALVILYFIPLHFDPRVYTHPDAWNPDHFANENAHRYKTAFFPFGVGPRGCIGIQFTKVAVKTQIVHILRKYRVTTNMTLKQIVLVPDALSRSKNGYPVRLHLRHE